MRSVLALLLMTHTAPSQTEPADEFDYYVLSPPRSPNWCASQGLKNPSPQCNKDAGFGWVLHGLWPQYETGWPSYCRTNARDRSPANTDAMADIFGAAGSAWQQQIKHGRCSGLDAETFFETARRAYEMVELPSVFRKLTGPVKLQAHVMEQAFLRSNPTFTNDMLTVTCKASRIQEVRLCLTKHLATRLCGQDERRDCQMSNALIAPIQ